MLSLSEHLDVFLISLFLIGPFSQPPNEDCSQVLNVEKVYRLLDPKDESNASAFEFLALSKT